MESSSKEEGFSEEGLIRKCCYDCKTTKTPLWRRGPSGPKSLCNACGIRHRKKLLSTQEGQKVGCEKKNDEKKTFVPETQNDAENRKIGKKKKDMKLKNGLKVNLLGLKRITSQRQWSEVERAALLLMALSWGAVFD